MEYRRKCQVCGKIYCYTDKEVSSNKMNKIGAALTGFAMLSGASRTVFDDILLTQRGDSFSNGIRDFNKCPSCGSMSTVEFNGEIELAAQSSTPQPEAIAAPAAPHIEINTNASPEALVKRAMLFMEDGDWDTAKAYCNAALDADPENAVAYTALLMVEQKAFPVEKLAESEIPFDDNVNYKRALRYAPPEFAEEIKKINQTIVDRIALADKQKAYDDALHDMKCARTESEFLYAAEKFRSLIPFQNSELLAEQCTEKAAEKKTEAQAKLEADYQSAVSAARSASDKNSCWKAINSLKALNGYKDSEEQIALCQKTIDRLEEEMRQAEARRVETEKKAAAARAKKQTKLAVVAVLLVMLVGAGYWAYQNVIIPNQNYNAAVALMQKGEINSAILAFEAMNGYKDSEAKITECHGILRENTYQYALAKMEEGKYEEAIEVFSRFKEYKDSADQIEVCLTAIKDRDYAAADSLMQSGKYEEAVIAFKALNGYRDSAEQVTTCQTAIKDRDYAAAESLMQSGKYEEAIAAFKALDGYRNSKGQLIDCQYLNAVSLNESGKYQEAYNIFITLKGYKDTDSLLETNDGLKKAAHEAKIAPFKKVGNYVVLGRYEQDNIISNGKEPIEWLVLDVDGEKALLLSKYGLDTMPFSTGKSLTWQNCTLRTWMNDSFIHAAFSVAEQNAILTTTVSNSKSQGVDGYSTNGGGNTEDKIFLLSFAEAHKYLNVEKRPIKQSYEYRSNATAIATGTQYAVSKFSKYYSHDLYNHDWWLRSPGLSDTFSLQITGKGYADSTPSPEGRGLVRPAMWVDLDADIF